MEDEGIVIAGLLVGLNVIDCNLGIKDEDLDQPVRIVIIIFFYFKEFFCFAFDYQKWNIGIHDFPAPVLSLA